MSPSGAKQVLPIGISSAQFHTAGLVASGLVRKLKRVISLIQLVATCLFSLCWVAFSISTIIPSFLAANVLGFGREIAPNKAEVGTTMDFATSSGGLMVHSRSDWPCASCRPEPISDSHGFCLCVKCAHGVISAAEAGSEGARALLDDVTDALVLLECSAASLRGWMN